MMRACRRSVARPWCSARCTTPDSRRWCASRSHRLKRVLRRSSCPTGQPAAVPNRFGRFGQDRYGKLRTLRWRGQDGRSFASCTRGLPASLHSIASSKEPAMIKKILAHLARRTACRSTRQPPPFSLRQRARRAGLKARNPTGLSLCFATIASHRASTSSARTVQAAENTNPVRAELVEA